ncbi:NAD(P)-dependent oxidoreductase [Dietzia sp. SYD-A1]|uniref:NAD-dependent epimerase/dehydratase family protein n=1 Tax=Dietzia sp. SYD-A1 TaxID=2780141 RepID=UPI00189116C4
MTRVAVVGATGFVGEAVCAALRNRGHEVLPVRAPRLTADPSAAVPELEVAALKEAAAAADAVVNCAGMPDATSGNRTSMMGANAVLPGLIAEIAAVSRVRFVHVSSAAVQGRRPVLDASSEMAPFSPYSESKAAGERAALVHPNTIVYRPPGVHGAQRRVTRAIARLARSPMSSVAGTGSANTAQALIENVGDAIAFLATCSAQPPTVVSHPTEGLTAASLLEDLGGKRPRHIPQPLARAIVDSSFIVAKAWPGINGAARRLEMLWFGQGQAPSWLTTAGWTPPSPRSTWRAIGRALTYEPERKDNP